ncbi:Fc.00g045600.m01.CDS01 [Cosmosporella sp. VM-42]
MGSSGMKALLLLLLLNPTYAFTTRPCTTGSSTVYQFDNGTFVENIGVRSNGHLILTLLSEATVYTIDPSESEPTPTKLHSFPHATGIAGITEIGDDIFAIVSAVHPNTTSPTTWKLDFSSGALNVSALGTVSGSQAINGITAVRKTGEPAIAILLADTQFGQLRRMDIETGEVETIASSDLFLPSTETFALGINGIKTFGSSVYWTASFSGSFGRVPLTLSGYADGEVEVLAKLNRTVGSFDDFQINPKGLVFFAVHTQNVMVYDVVNGGELRMLENSTALVQPTSVAFGRGQNDTESLYVTCAGAPISNTTYLAASVQKIDIQESMVNACISNTDDGKGSGGITSSAVTRFNEWMAISGGFLGVVAVMLL